MKTIIDKLKEVSAIIDYSFEIKSGDYKMEAGMVSVPFEMKHKHIQFLKDNKAKFDLSKKRKPTQMNGNEFILDVIIPVDFLVLIQKYNGKNSSNNQMFSFMNDHMLLLNDFPYKRIALSEKGAMSRVVKIFPKQDEKLKISKRFKMFKKDRVSYSEKSKTTFYYA